jgi:hypothetical protein
MLKTGGNTGDNKQQVKKNLIMLLETGLVTSDMRRRLVTYLGKVPVEDLPAIIGYMHAVEEADRGGVSARVLQ